MERALVNAPYTLEATVYQGGDPTDPAPDAATVTVTRADGTVLLSDVGTNNTGTGTFARTLQASQMGLLDVLRADWEGTIGGEPFTLTTYTEVVGGFLCPLADLRPLFPSADDRELARVRTAAEERLERAIGARVPRYAYERRIAGRMVHLEHGPVRAVRSLDVAGYVYGQAALDVLVFTGSTVYGVGGSRYRAVTIGYEYGEDYPDETVREAVKLTAAETFDTTGDGRVVRREADGQAVTFASPSSTSGFVNPTLRAMVNDLVGAQIA